MVDRVERFAKVDRHGQGSMGWPGLIEAQGHLVSEGKEGSGGAVVGAEAVLVGGKGESIKFGEEESF